ncbi:hypothetical protein T01_14995 [Trichinella spiralis]|uniref:Uncharacterized protein n=1 Tax=Trichinella spiralis TaxID=6334 RepID=A0A0V0Z329_TRISP|nr:hypothetical protein T01_14995 [Trichinella spiralis]
MAGGMIFTLFQVSFCIFLLFLNLPTFVFEYCILKLGHDSPAAN